MAVTLSEKRNISTCSAARVGAFVVAALTGGLAAVALLFSLLVPMFLAPPAVAGPRRDVRTLASLCEETGGAPVERAVAIDGRGPVVIVPIPMG